MIPEVVMAVIISLNFSNLLTAADTLRIMRFKTTRNVSVRAPQPPENKVLNFLLLQVRK